MKTILTLCVLGGVALSVGWERTKPDSVEDSSTSISARRPEDQPRRRELREVEFQLEVVEKAIRFYDKGEKADPFLESRLRGLMFTVPSEHLGAVLAFLDSVEQPDRFGGIAASFYARWAELDATAAWDAALENEGFVKEARYGVMMTWLNIEPDAAVEVIVEEKRPSDIGILEDFLRGKVQNSPREAALLVDAVTSLWPEVDKRLFPLVAKQWANSEPLAAGEWVESYWDASVRNPLLRELAIRVAKTRGFEGLNLADRIDDPGLRSEARLKAIRWWGTSSGGFSLTPERAHWVGDLTGGFPSDWTPDEIRRFSMATMVNFSKNYPDLLEVAQSDSQREWINEGVIWGSGFSNPAAVSQAIESVSDVYAQSATGAAHLRTFIRRWNEQDPASARGWLGSQPEGPKTNIMMDELGREGE